MKWRPLLLCRALLWLLPYVLLTANLSPAAFAGNGPVRLSVAFSPGGALDVAARALAKEAEKELGVSIIVQNTPSGGGMTAVARLADARPDGSNLAACVSNALVFIPHRSSVPYDPLRDVEPLLAFGQASPVLVTRPDAPWKTLDDFLEATCKSAGDMRIGVPGLGTPSHIALAVMAAKDPSLKWRFVPFGGPGEAETALLGGHVDAAASGALPRIRKGQLHPLMVLAGTGLRALPEVPSLADRGFSDPGRGDSTFLLLAPAGTKEEVLDRLAKIFEKAASSETFLNALTSYSVAPVLMNREEAKAFLRNAWDEESSILNAVGIADTPAAASASNAAGKK